MLSWPLPAHVQLVAGVLYWVRVADWSQEQLQALVEVLVLSVVQLLVDLILCPAQCREKRSLQGDLQSVEQGRGPANQTGWFLQCQVLLVAQGAEQGVKEQAVVVALLGS